MHSALRRHLICLAGCILSASLMAGAFLVGCTHKSDSPAVKKEPVSLYDRGRIIYVTRCIACHNQDPHQPGSIGPAIYGSSLELVTARVMHAGYPPGYKPQRTTHIMPPLPDLKADIPAIHAFLNGKK